MYTLRAPFSPPGPGPPALFCAVFGLDEGDVVPLEHDPFERLPGVPLEVDLNCFVQDQVHVLVEAWTDNC